MSNRSFTFQLTEKTSQQKPLSVLPFHCFDFACADGSESKLLVVHFSCCFSSLCFIWFTYKLESISSPANMWLLLPLPPQSFVVVDLNSDWKTSGAASLTITHSRSGKTDELTLSYAVSTSKTCMCFK